MVPVSETVAHKMVASVIHTECNRVQVSSKKKSWKKNDSCKKMASLKNNWKKHLKFEEIFQLEE